MPLNFDRIGKEKTENIKTGERKRRWED